jgi:hypothetical protein
MSRIRQIKPSWFLDKQLRRGTTAEAREFYVGLWMLADDDGWLVWDVERIGAELYPYDDVEDREANIAGWADVLEHLDPEHPHLVIYQCGHAQVPKMKAHQRIAGNRTTTVSERHRVLCASARSRLSLQEATRSPGIGIGRVGNGRVEGGTGGEGETSEFRSLVGLPSFMEGKT